MNLITVPEYAFPDGHVEPAFLVGQYLTSQGADGKATITADGIPWVRINYAEAKAAAAETGLSLITERQWLSIAYDISLQDINWTGGKVGKGCIYMGLHKGTVSKAQSATYESPDSEERRWHQLSSGERIYDFAGNAFSWIFDDVQGNADGTAGKIAGDSISLTTAPHPSSEMGMGWRPDGARDWSGGALIRGGYWCSESNAGVFYLLSVWPDCRGDYVGFRCTKSL